MSTNGKSEVKAPLPPIPAKRYFTIGEVSELCGVKPHVLRYWEQEFTQLRPMKRRGNRRYYQHHEVLLVRRIRELLYEEGFTINGARNRLSEIGGSRIRVSGMASDPLLNGHDMVADEGVAGELQADELAAIPSSSPVLNAGVDGMPRAAVSITADLTVSRGSARLGSPFEFDSVEGQGAVRKALLQALELLR